jgi:ABC-type uncharacterized transport system substrate-binding protein
MTHPTFIGVCEVVNELTKIEFVINLDTAKALGLTIQASVFAVVDEVIE